MEVTALPGGDLVEAGLRDLAHGVESVPALLVSIGAARLRNSGLTVETPIAQPEERLYSLLEKEDSDTAHSRYNALVRRLVSFERAAECETRVDESRIHEFMRTVGREAGAEGRVYLTGGTTAVLIGWRTSTIDVDIKIVPEQDSIFRALPAIKEALHINVELAAPDQFIPELPGWPARSLFIEQHGPVSFHHYDFYAQALAKIERHHLQDLADVQEMIARGLVDPSRALELLFSIEPHLYRYPAINAPAFRRAAEKILAKA